MSKHQKPLAIVLGAAFALGGAAVQASVFQATDLSSGYMIAAASDDKAGEQKCGEKKTEEKNDKAAEGKCGEGKCGEGKCGEKKAD